MCTTSTLYRDFFSLNTQSLPYKIFLYSVPHYITNGNVHFNRTVTYKKRLPKSHRCRLQYLTQSPTPSHIADNIRCHFPQTFRADPDNNFAANGIGAAARAAIVASDAAVPAPPRNRSFKAPDATFLSSLTDRLRSRLIPPQPFSSESSSEFADDFAALAIPVDDWTPLNLLLTRVVSFVEIPLSFTLL